MAIKSTQHPEEPCNILINNASNDDIIFSKGKVSRFAVNHAGLTNLHPNPDPSQWPETTQAIDKQCLRMNFNEMCDSEDLSKLYESRVNLVQRHTCTPNYCLSYAKRDKETKEPKCRFQFPKDIHGFNTITDDQNKIISQSRLRVDENKMKDLKLKHKEEERVAPMGASIVNGKICPIRNHHRVVQHMKEMPLIWGANTEAQVVTSWIQLIMYIVKYVMKAEKPSDAFKRIAKELLQKEGENVPTRKVFTSLLMNSIDRDISRAECALIIHYGEYVQYSQRFEWVNLNGTKRLKQNVLSEDDLAMETIDWLHIYAEREEHTHCIELCNNYPDNFKWHCHPNDISLRQFVTYFTKHWKLKDPITVPVFSPTQKFPVNKKNKSYESWCKFILLAEKPGCYITNGGNDFSSFEEELRDFVHYSIFCPELVKQEFEQSQLELEVNTCPDNIFEEEDQLLVSPLHNPDEEEIVPTQFQIHQIQDDIDIEQQRDDDLASDYDAEEFIALEHDWVSDRTILLNDIPEHELQSAHNWLEMSKLNHVDTDKECRECRFQTM